jgi:hypothetical protein
LALVLLNVTVPASSLAETVYGPVPHANEAQGPVSEIVRFKEFATTVGVTALPSAQVAPLRILKVTEFGLDVHDSARYGTISPFEVRATNVSYKADTIGNADTT